MELSDIAEYVTERVNSKSITLNQYVTTDSLLQNKRGRQTAQNLPPMTCALTRYCKGDILISNIRPYLKKIWLADSDGGCSTDVLAFRTKNGHSPNYLYALLMQDAFFQYMMQGSKGSKMPRGDKNQIMHYSVPTFSSFEEENIGNIIVNIERKIALNRQINDNLEAMARQLYDYWFVQFDFPDENGKPYKSSGGKMAWNEKLKRNIPELWADTTLGCICDLYQPQTLGLSLLSEDEPFKVYGANGIVGHYNKYNHKQSEIAMACRGNSCGVLNRTMPKSWITGNAMVIHLKDETINNEYIKQALKYANVKGAISGSGQPQLTRENLEVLNIIKPSQEILLLYSIVVAPLVEKELNMEKEIDRLTKQRDELLPLLMNGQATVNYHLSDD